MDLMEIGDRMSKISAIEKLLKDKGYKSTYSRKEIIQCFLDSEKHLRPEDIYEKVRESGISLPTVYRNIEMLKENKIISELNAGGERFYELRMFSQKVLHLHYKCDTCNHLIEITDTDLVLDLINLKNKVEKRYDNTIDDIEIIIQRHM